MNERQRQVLADELDRLIRDMEALDESIVSLERSLLKKRNQMAVMVAKKTELEEGVDW